LNLSGTPFSLEAKDAPHWFEHLDNFANHHVAYYTIVLKFEYNNLPTTVWNDINNTNDLYDLMFSSITVADAISKITGLETYVEFIPKNTEIVRGSGRIFINGFRKDFQFTAIPSGISFISGILTAQDCFWRPQTLYRNNAHAECYQNLQKTRPLTPKTSN
jgi:hypothetical protein